MKPSNIKPRDITNAISDALSLLEGIEVLHDNGFVDFATTTRSDEDGMIELVVSTGEVFRITIERTY